ncbi:class I SAM-dependent methyltransferase [Salibacterium aidingense]|uniref:class I SAM-dependent methyltransferase n=1 Tax=Salibacterium aidingense TaxID=384933 RepID=UPI003BE32A7E
MSTLFSKIYDPIMRPFEKKRLGNLRERLISHQEGTILEVGSGTGANFSYYKNAEKVVAIEPNASMINQSLSKVKRAEVPVELVDASGEHLPFDDNTFDAAIGTLVLCTILNPSRALQEIRRVCKPGVPILFIEAGTFLSGGVEGSTYFSLLLRICFWMCVPLLGVLIIYIIIMTIKKQKGKV